MVWKLGLLSFVFISAVAYGQDCDSQCRSQLLRVEVSSNVLKDGGAAGLLPSLQKLAESPTLQGAIEREFPLVGIPFPHNKATCLREKAEGDSDFTQINCEDPGICSNPNLKADVKEKICFKLPCPILEGTLNPGKCDDTKDIYPSDISFPTPLKIQKIRLEPTTVEFKNNEAKLCFKINELDISMSTSLVLNTSGTSLTDKEIKIDNINPVLDGPRDMCVMANLEIGGENPISNIRIEPVGSAPFISDNMIRSASEKLLISGLSGYPENTLNSIKSELVPVVFQPLRSSLETALKESLGKAFEGQIHQLIDPLTQEGKSLKVDSTNIMSELGIANMQVRGQVEKLECAALKQAKRSIPASLTCQEERFPSYSIELARLSRMMKDNKVTSESIKQRLINLREVILDEKVSDFFLEGASPEKVEDLEAWHLEAAKDTVKKELNPIIDQIANNQLENELYKFVEIQNQIHQGMSNNIGLSLPEICSETPSPHANRSMKNCPVQVYADLNEFNQILTKMWETGRACMKGQGQYQPQLDSTGKQAYDAEGKPLSSGGCYLEMAGMGCHMKSAPQIKFNAKTKKYNVSVNLQSCYRGPVILGMGRFGGDFNIDFSFDPKACNNGDFCMENPDVNWSVVKGTERFGMKDSSFFKDLITDKFNEAISGALKDTIRLPMASGVGPLANVPLKAEGRVDSGPGFFGACLEIDKGSQGQ